MRPTEITRYVSLVSEQPLDAGVAKAWFRCVRERAPEGVCTTIEIGDDEGNSHAVQMIKREDGKTNSYMVPLSRDLTEAEAQRIVAGFANDNPDLDFDIEATVIRTGDQGMRPAAVNVQQEKFLDLCTSLSKKQHEDWVKSRTNDGWRYGQTVSLTDKTHPLLRPWDQLPDRYRQIDTDQPQRLLDLLAQHGYAVVNKDDLDAVLRLVRSVR